MLVRKVWDVINGTVLVTDEKGLSALMNGADGPTPIGFPMEDVFAYDEEVARAIISGLPPEWDRLVPFTAGTSSVS